MNKYKKNKNQSKTMKNRIHLKRDELYGQETKKYKSILLSLPAGVVSLIAYKYNTFNFHQEEYMN